MYGLPTVRALQSSRRQPANLLTISSTLVLEGEGKEKRARGSMSKSLHRGKKTYNKTIYSQAYKMQHSYDVYIT